MTDENRPPAEEDFLRDVRETWERARNCGSGADPTPRGLLPAEVEPSSLFRAYASGRPVLKVAHEPHDLRNAVEFELLVGERSWSVCVSRTLLEDKKAAACWFVERILPLIEEGQKPAPDSAWKCPWCGGGDVSSKCLGFMLTDLNLNRAACLNPECGWVGKAYEIDGTPKERWPE